MGFELAAFILATVAGVWGVVERAWMAVLISLSIILMLWTTIVDK